MKKLLKTTIVLFLIALTTGLIWSKYFYQSSENRTESTINNSEFETIPSIEPTKFIFNPEHQITQSAWIPNWASYEGLLSFENNIDKFSSISPVWYEVNTDGSLLDKKPAIFQSISNLARENNIELIPAISMFDHDLFSQVLNNDESLERHVREIVKVVEVNDYDGIDLDYESTKLRNKSRYFKFLEELATELKAQDKTLVVTVLAKWGNDIRYPSLPETREVQDWSRIAKHADEIRIMAYDYTFSKAAQPGPIAPIDWVEQVLDYAISEVPREKIVLGVHLYSYEWYIEVEENDEISGAPSLAFQPDFSDNPYTNSNPARSYTYKTVQRILESYGGDLIEFQGEKVYRYRQINHQTQKLEDRVLVFTDSEGVAARKELAKNYNIKGVIYWRLGEEGDLL